MPDPGQQPDATPLTAAERESMRHALLFLAALGDRDLDTAASVLESADARDVATRLGAMVVNLIEQLNGVGESVLGRILPTVGEYVQGLLAELREMEATGA